MPASLRSLTAATLAGAALLAGWLVAARSPADEPKATPAIESAAGSDAPAEVIERRLYSGKVVDVREALAKRGIKSFDEFKGQVALETADGRLLPIVPDWRGRAFYQDQRLRNRTVDLIGFQKGGVPYLQVLMVFTFDEQGTRQYTDYWCDICAIPMYEIKPCDCCQAEIRLRFQPQELPADLSADPGTRP